MIHINSDIQKRIDELSKQIDKEWVALNDQKMKIFELSMSCFPIFLYFCLNSIQMLLQDIIEKVIKR